MLNIYDTSGYTPYLHPFGLGIYHCAVEVYNTEYVFQLTTDGETEICEVSPKTLPNCRYRETMFMGRTRKSPDDVAKLIQVMKNEYSRQDYDALTWNNQAFSNDFLMRLGGPSLPNWIGRSSKIAKCFRCCISPQFLNGSMQANEQTRVSNVVDLSKVKEYLKLERYT